MDAFELCSHSQQSIRSPVKGLNRVLMKHGFEAISIPEHEFSANQSNVPGISVYVLLHQFSYYSHAACGP